jgi:uncharacterized protein DUF4440
VTVTRDAVAELRALEEERCRAISEGDWTALANLLREDYSHSHSTAVVEDKATYLEFIKGRPRTTTRRDEDDGWKMAAFQSTRAGA